MLIYNNSNNDLEIEYDLLYNGDTFNNKRVTLLFDTDIKSTCRELNKIPNIV